MVMSAPSTSSRVGQSVTMPRILPHRRAMYPLFLGWLVLIPLASRGSIIDQDKYK